jgi:hypothetical protein
LAATIDPMFWAQVNIIKIETAGKVGKDLRAKTKATDEGFTSLIKLFVIKMVIFVSSWKMIIMMLSVKRRLKNKI